MENIDEIFPQQNSGLNTEKVGEEIIVYDQANEMVHQLNQTASFIWEYCTGKLSIAEIVTKMAEKFEEKQSAILKDVMETLDHFKKSGLINM